MRKKQIVVIIVVVAIMGFLYSRDLVGVKKSTDTELAVMIKKSWQPQQFIAHGGKQADLAVLFRHRMRIETRQFS